MGIRDQSESEENIVSKSFYWNRAGTYFSIFLFVELIIKGVFVGLILGRQSLEEVVNRFPNFCIITALYFVSFVVFALFVEFAVRTRSDEHKNRKEPFLFMVAERAFTFWVILHCLVIAVAAWSSF